MWSGSWNDLPPALGRNFGSYDPSISLMVADKLAASCLVRVQTSSSSSKDLQIGEKGNTDNRKSLRPTVEASVLLARNVYFCRWQNQRRIG